MSGDLKNILEAVLLASDAPLSVAKLQSVFARDLAPGADALKQAIAELQSECDGRGVELRKIGGGYRYQSRPRYAEWIRKLHAARPPRLSRALLETLAIIAYRQPVTRGDIEDIRGITVSPDIMRRLVERGWVAEVGARDVPGRPALFATTREFLSYFNLESLRELPPLSAERAFGEVAAELDTPLPPEVLAALRDSATAGDATSEIPVDGDGESDGNGEVVGDGDGNCDHDGDGESVGDRDLDGDGDGNRDLDGDGDGNRDHDGDGESVGDRDLDGDGDDNRDLDGDGDDNRDHDGDGESDGAGHSHSESHGDAGAGDGDTGEYDGSHGDADSVNGDPRSGCA